MPKGVIIKAKGTANCPYKIQGGSKMKKMITLLLVIVMATALFAGCAKKEEPAKTETKKEEPAKTETKEEPEAEAEAAEIYIPVISKGFQHQFWQAVKKGAEQAALDFDVTVTFEGPESEAAVDEQIAMLEAALAKNPSAICLAALDSKAVIPLVEQAVAAGIPVIGFDSGVDTDLLATTAATDNIAASMEAADQMAKLIGEEGKVAIVVHDQTSRTGIDRRDGFVQRIEDKYPNIEIVDIQYGGGDHLKSTEIAKTIIAANPDLKGFFGANEGSAVGVLNALKELDMEGDIVAIGYDAGKQQMDAVRSGISAGAITQDPVGIGYKAVESAVKAIKGEKLPEVVDTGFYYYTVDNMDEEKIAGALYE